MGGKKLERYYQKLLSQEGKFSFDFAVKEFLFQYVLKEFKHGTESNSILNRNSILHGADANYGTVSNSLSCILLFDYLQERFGVVSVGQGKHYHLSGCLVVLRYRIDNNSSWILYKDKSDAESNGKKPCKPCNP